MKYLKVFEKFYHPSTEIKDKLKNIISNLLIKHEGGRKFFDALDDSIKSIVNEDITIALLKGNSNEWIASSGEFGDRIYDLWKNKKIKCKGVVVFNGKMATHEIGVHEWYPDNFDISNKQFVYVDDSYFSGNTVKKINDFLLKMNSSIKVVSVIYDGSKIKSKMVKSFFRYYS